MKKIIGLFAIGVCVLVSMQARGAITVAQWTFDNTWIGGSTANIGTSSTPNAGISGATIAADATGGVNASVSGITISGTDRQMRFTSASANGSTLNNSLFIVKLTVNTAVSGTFQITYDARANVTSGGTTTDTWRYSINGGSTWTPIGADTIGTTYASFSDMSASGISLNSGESIWFENTLTGATGKSGTADFNNLNINFTGAGLVPEPITYAMALFGLVFVGTGVGRYYLGKSRKTA